MSFMLLINKKLCLFGVKWDDLIFVESSVTCQLAVLYALVCTSVLRVLRRMSDAPVL